MTYQRLDVEALRRLDLLDIFLRHFLENGRLTSVIKAEYEDLCLLGRLSSQVAQQIKKSHIVSLAKLMNYYRLEAKKLIMN
jgi:hypothetical protein